MDMYIRISDKKFFRDQIDKSITINQWSIKYLVKSVHVTVASKIGRKNNFSLKYFFVSFKSFANKEMTDNITCWKGAE